METVPVVKFKTKYQIPSTSTKRQALIFLLPEETPDQKRVIILEIWDVPLHLRYQFFLSGDANINLKNCSPATFDGMKDIRESLVKKAKKALGLN